MSSSKDFFLKTIKINFRIKFVDIIFILTAKIIEIKRNTRQHCMQYLKRVVILILNYFSGEFLVAEGIVSNYWFFGRISLRLKL